MLLDGAIAGSAALVAAALCPTALEYALAGHTSVEPGHAIALDPSGLRPLLGLNLRLGEGTGALLALPLVKSAARALRDVATFDSAGVTEKSCCPRVPDPRGPPGVADRTGCTPESGTEPSRADRDRERPLSVDHGREREAPCPRPTSRTRTSSSG